jgi:hypothetical protein
LAIFYLALSKGDVSKHEVHQNPKTSTASRTGGFDLKTTYLLLIRAYLRSKLPQIDEVSVEERKS